MRKIFTLTSLLVVFSICQPVFTYSQVVVSGSTGLDGNYPNLGHVAVGFFAALELGPDQTGNNIIVTITADIANEAGERLLMGRNWNSLRIIPSGHRIISGNHAGYFIGLAFATNVTIDGLNDGSNSLTLENLSTASLGSTIMFSNNSSFNTVRNLNCKSSGANDGVIFITNSATGNQHNLIENCDISASAAGTPMYGVVSISGPLNNDNTIRNCNIHDIYSTTGDSYGIYIAFGAGRTVIENNRIYQTATRIPTTGNPTFTGIAIGFTDGDGFIIRNNFIGGSNATGTGYSVYGSTTSGPGFIGIRARQTGFSPTSFPSRTIITGNRISGIDIISNKANNTNNIGVFVGIDLSNGINTDSIRCSNNIIGGISGNDSIKITALTTTAIINCIGIRNSSTRGNTIDSNTIGAITMISTSGNRTSGFIGIQADPASASGILPIRNNTIGNADVPNSITSNYTGLGAQLAGIRLAGISPNATFVVKGNTIQNLQHTGGNAGTGVVASVAGILSITNANHNVQIEENIITNLSNIGVTTAAIEITGIRWIPPSGAGAPAAIISKNKVYNLSIPNSSNTNSKLTGLMSQPGIGSHITNNMISIGTNTPGKVYAMEASGSNIKMYNNSCRVLGSGAIAEGAALLRSALSSIDLKNNILYNERTGTPNSQYAVAIPVGLSVTFPYTGSNNLYYSSGTNVALNASTGYTTLPLFATVLNALASNAETNSKTATVSFASATDLHTSDIAVINGGMNLSLATPAITTDIDGETRNTCFDIGADEANYTALPNTATWTGAIDTKWCTVCNWDKGAIPLPTDDVLIPAGLSNFPIINSAAACPISTANNIIINNNAQLTLETGGTLELYGSLNNNGTYTNSIGGNLVLKGTALQTINSNTSPITFYNVQSNGSGLKQLTTSATINGMLTMTDGNVEISNHAVTTAAISGGSLASHIITNGTGLLTVKAVGAGPVLFPIGPEAASYNPFSITNGQSIDYSTKVETGINPNISFPGIAVNRTWTINTSVIPSGFVGIEFEYANGHGNAGFNYSSNVEIGKYIVPAWSVIQAGVTPIGNYKVASLISSFNAPFAIGNIGSFLAIDFTIQCKARKNNDDAIINFTMADADATHSFHIERSINNGAFTTIATLPAHLGEPNYSFTDLSIPTGMILYRVKNNRAGRSASYSNIAVVSNEKKSLSLISLYPNPVNSYTNLLMNVAKSGRLSLILVDITGKMIRQWNETVSTGNNTISISTEGLAKGVYSIIATDQINKSVINFVKK